MFEEYAEANTKTAFTKSTDTTATEFNEDENMTTKPFFTTATAITESDTPDPIMTLENYENTAAAPDMPVVGGAPIPTPATPDTAAAEKRANLWWWKEMVLGAGWILWIIFSIVFMFLAYNRKK